MPGRGFDRADHTAYCGGWELVASIRRDRFQQHGAGACSASEDSTASETLPVDNPQFGQRPLIFGMRRLLFIKRVRIGPLAPRSPPSDVLAKPLGCGALFLTCREFLLERQGEAGGNRVMRAT